MAQNVAKLICREINIDDRMNFSIMRPGTKYEKKEVACQMAPNHKKVRNTENLTCE